jgi:antiviral helicase SKI2
LLGVIVKAQSTSNKQQYIVLVLKPNLPSMVQSPLATSNLQDKISADFPEGYILVGKGKRDNEEEYYSSAKSRKGSGAINIKLPRHGTAAGVSYEVREVDSKEFLCICDCKIKVDQVGLLEDGSSGAYSKTVQQLLGLKKSDGNKYPPALDPKGMTIFQ